MEVPKPVIDDRAFAANLTNEGGAGGTFQLLSNGTGLWLLHECRRTWDLQRPGFGVHRTRDHGRVGATFGLAGRPQRPGVPRPRRHAPAHRRLVPPAPARASPTARPPWCAACWKAWRWPTARRSSLLTTPVASSPPAVHIVGGGARNELLCQLTADATGLPVWAGPTEASEVGNLLVQAMALGELSSLDDARAWWPSLSPPRCTSRGDKAPGTTPTRLTPGQPARPAPPGGWATLSRPEVRSTRRRGYRALLDQDVRVEAALSRQDHGVAVAGRLVEVETPTCAAGQWRPAASSTTAWTSCCAWLSSSGAPSMAILRTGVPTNSSRGSRERMARTAWGIEAPGRGTTRPWPSGGRRYRPGSWCRRLRPRRRGPLPPSPGAVQGSTVGRCSSALVASSLGRVSNRALSCAVLTRAWRPGDVSAPNCLSRAMSVRE